MVENKVGQFKLFEVGKGFKLESLYSTLLLYIDRKF